MAITRRKKKNDGFDVGQDSFQDVVSNIVGILIILVVITGIRMGRLPASEGAIQKEEQKREAILDEAKEKLLGQIEETDNAVAERQSAARDLYDAQALFEARTEEKSEWINMISAANAAIAVQSNGLSEAEKAELEAKRKIAELERRIEEAKRTEKWLAQGETETVVLENRPTPLANNVKDNEAHFRLSGGRISHVPFGLLVEKMVGEVRSQGRSFLNRDVLVDSVGPVDGYTLKYRIMGRNVTTGPYATSQMRSVELDYCEFIPERETIGENLADAMKPGSQFQKHLSQYPPGVYTVTIWVYPDSFKEFREVREFMYKRGYLCAARPLPKGAPISASPHGTASTAQ